MKSRFVSASLSALLALLAASCLCGQTGQPEATQCADPRTLAADALWQGRTAAQAVAAFEGTHRAPLRWFVEPHGAREADMTKVELEDSVAFEISYEGELGSLGACDTHLQVPVMVEITTMASGLVDRGEATLGFYSLSTTERAELAFSGEVLSVTGRLSPTDSAKAPEGFLEPRAGDAPGASASFP